MPVIINEFEVVTEPPASPQAGTTRAAGEAQGAAQQLATAALSPHDVESILHRQAERQARVWAH